SPPRSRAIPTRSPPACTSCSARPSPGPEPRSSPRSPAVSPIPLPSPTASLSRSSDMPLATTADLFSRAVAAGHGLPAFNVLHLETAEAIAAGAERTGAGVVLQISQNCVRFHGSLAPLAAATRAIAEASSAPLSLHLDHAEDLDLVREALDLGFSSVMYDGATLDYPQNVANTRTAVAAAHAVGATVEAELGEIGGKDGAHAP